MPRSRKRIIIQTLLLAGPASLLFLGFLGAEGLLLAVPVLLLSLLVSASLERSWQKMQELLRL